jgi:plastocyanin
MVSLTSLIIALVSLAFIPEGDAGEVRGRVEFTGMRPKEEWVQVQKDREVCGEFRPLERLLLSPEGGVANAVVELEGAQGEVRQGSVAVLDNRDCRFLPRVQVVPPGSALEIRNSDGTLHTAHAYRARDETLFHVALPHFREQVRVSLPTEGFLRVICDVGHTWMQAYILVTPNPFVTVTDTQGRFSLSTVPPGVYTVRVWHETLGIPSTKVTVPADGTAIVIFRY